MLSRYFLIGKGKRSIRRDRSVHRRLWIRGACLLLAMVLTFTLCIQVSAKEKPKAIAQEWQIRGIEAALGDDRGGVKAKAVEQLVDYQLQSAQALVRQDTEQNLAAILKDSQQDSEVRSNAAEALGNFGEAAKPYIPTILDILKDSQQDRHVRSSAAEALGNFGEAAKPYIPTILDILKDSQQDRHVRSSAAKALGNFGEAAKPYIPAILNIIRDPQQDSEVRSSAAEALGNFGEAAKPYIPAILDILKDSQQDRHVRSSAAKALGNFGEAAKPYIPAILDILKDSQQDRHVRSSAAKALGNFGEAAKPYIPAILDILKDSQQDRHVRSSAAEALSNFGEAAKPYIPAILNIIRDPQQDSEVRSSTAEALGNFGEAAKPYIPAILNIIRDPKLNSQIRSDTTEALGNFGEAAKPYIPEIADIFNDPQLNSEVRSSAAEALSNFGETATPYIPAILDFIKDPQQNSKVRSSAAEALSNFGEATKPYIPAILDFIKDPEQDSEVRSSAAEALGNFGEATKPYIPAIADIFKDPEQDSEVRSSAAEALGNFGEAAKPYIPAIADIFKDPQQDSEVRSSAAEALGKVGKLNLDQLVTILNLIYEDKASIDFWRFNAYFVSGGDKEVKRLLQWVGRPEQLPEQLSHDEGVKTLEIFKKTWDFSKNYLELREDLANKTARVTKLVNWQPTDLPLLHQHYRNLTDAHFTNADSVQAAITSLETWQWLATFRTLILTHAAFWLALIFAYPRSPQIQAIFFWNPWVRNILGMGYVPFLLAWIPFLRRKLFEPFQPSLLADAGLANFAPDLYFPDSPVQIGEVRQAIATLLPHLKGQIILEGDSGLGKTMFVRHLLKQSKRIAVYLPAPKCTEGVLEAIQKKLHGDEIKDPKFLQSLIYSGAIDIYIDGLNEVSADTRAKIAAFVESHFRGNILLATQPLEWNPPATAKTYVIQPLQPHQIEIYLLSRHPFLPKNAPVRGEDYQQVCCDFSQAIAAAAFAPEERQAVYSILSNPMELTLAAWILADNQQPNLLNLRQQQYDLMAIDYQRMWNRDFPLLTLSEAMYQLRLADKQALPSEEFYKELQCMEDEKYRMVISRQWQDAKGEAQKEWVFRHDKIAEFFIVQTFLGNSDEAKNRLQSHIGDSRFRGVYFLLATLLPIDAAQQLREDLINYAADTKDHTVSDTFVQLMRSRQSDPTPAIQ